MKIWLHFVKAPVRVTRISRKRSMIKLKRQMLMIKVALAQEKTETKEMLVIYRKCTQRQASSEEVQAANKQFLDILKGLGLGIFAVLPFAPITIPIAIKVGRLVGVEILPSSFSATSQTDKTNKSQT
jgi:hypothetical protein